MGGIPHRTDVALGGWVDRVVETAAGPLRAAAMVAEALANRHGASLADCGLALSDQVCEIRPGDTPGWPQGVAEALDSTGPYLIGRAYELALDPDRRRRSGSHLTPAAIARGVVGCIDGIADPAMWTRTAEPVVLDPAVGGGAFLLAVADTAMGAGLGADPERVLTALRGIDVAAEAVAAAEAALAVWGLGHGVEPRPRPGLVVGDGLLAAAGVDAVPVDIVVGNPPFLNQLRSDSSNAGARRQSLRDRWGELVRAYTDEAWLFIAAGMAALAPGGRLAMLNPISLLGARDAGPVRDHVGEQGRLAGIWLADAKVFDAEVDVCAVVAERDSGSADRSGRSSAERARGSTGAVRRWYGPEFAAAGEVHTSPGPWGPLVCDLVGIPRVSPLASRAPAGATLGDRAKVTAGFRDQFYGFVPVVADSASAGGPPDEPADQPPEAAPAVPQGALVTVGMIDPFELGWGTGSFRFAGVRYRAPVVDLAALATGDPRLSEWTQARLRPKVLVATQTRVIEVWVDPDGHAVPATPVISIEPSDPADPDLLWRLAAAVASPVTVARLAADAYGTALAASTVKVSATALAGVPLPGDRGAWKAAAEAVRNLHSPEPDPQAVTEFATAATSAYGLDAPELVTWWLGRLTGSRPGPKTE